MTHQQIPRLEPYTNPELSERTNRIPLKNPTILLRIYIINLSTSLPQKDLQTFTKVIRYTEQKEIVKVFRD